MKFIEKIKLLFPSYRQRRIEECYPIASKVLDLTQVPYKDLNGRMVMILFGRAFDEDHVMTMMNLLSEVSSIWYEDKVDNPALNFNKLLLEDNSLEVNQQKTHLEDLIRLNLRHHYPASLNDFTWQVGELLTMSQESIQEAYACNAINGIKTILLKFPAAVRFSRLHVFENDTERNKFRDRLVKEALLEEKEVKFINEINTLKTAKQYWQVNSIISTIGQDLNILHEYRGEIIRSYYDLDDDQKKVFEYRQKELRNNVDNLHQMVTRLKW